MSAFQPDIDSYLEDLRVARRCSPHTVSNYARDLKSVAAYRRRPGASKTWNGPSCLPMLRAIVAEQHRAGIAGRSLARRLSALRGLYNHLVGLGKVRR